MRFQVRYVVYEQPALISWEIFRLSIAICSAQCNFLQSVLDKNWKTILLASQLFAIPSLFSQQMFERQHREARRKPEKFDKICLLSIKTSLMSFHFRPITTTLHKARENWTCKGVTLISHAFWFYVFTEFFFKTSWFPSNNIYIQNIQINCL